jgi:heme-degrading monooxygenase HmoA
MIVRVWRGWAMPEKYGDYPEHFRKAVLPELRATPGFLGAVLMQRRQDGEIEFRVETRWASLDAIRAFAGEALDRAVVEPGAVAALVRFEETVSHFEVLESVDA